LQIGPSGYWRHTARQRNPALHCARAQRDAALMPHIQRVWQVNLQVYGADKVWRQLNREGLPYPLDRVNRQFRADRPNQLWVSDFTYVSTWQGWLYVAFVIDVFARRIVGWRVSCRMCTDFMLDALKQALYVRQPGQADALVHHSDRGVQYVSIRYTERLAEAGIEPSVGTKGQL